LFRDAVLEKIYTNYWFSLYCGDRLNGLLHPYHDYKIVNDEKIDAITKMLDLSSVVFLK